MNEGLLKAELNNLAAFFNDETAYIHVSDEIYNSSKEDTWTTFLNAYLSNDQKNMAFCIGRLSQLDWPDKEKILWKILLSSRCEGSNAEIHRLMVQADNSEVHSYLDELLAYAVNILAGRELQSRRVRRKEELENLEKNRAECEDRVLRARQNLQDHHR